MASIRKRGPYQWEVRVRRKGYPLQCNTFESKAEAEAWASTIESEMARKVFRSFSEAENTLFTELLDRYGEELTPKKRGAKQEASKLRVISRYPIAEYSIALIGGKELAEYRNTRLKSVSPKTVHDELVLIGHVIKVAMQDWGLALPHGNPIESVRKPKVGNNSRDRRIFGEEEKRLLAACKEYGEPLPSIVTLALETGMRRGEIADLQWKYINLKNNTLHLPETKNEESRDVPLSSTAIRTLNKLPRNINGRVFSMRADSITKAFSRSCSRACEHVFERMAGEETDCDNCEGIKNLRFHDLRHEATSRFFELGLNPMQVAAITGHKTLQMLQRYTHLKAEDLAKLLN
ncbi:site-specific tyrosine recombinase XerC [Mariprofundus micogutta]|uniref:Site-specific tyrosine recombinase XerC n=1 Tax=Mariprofundus micogutta TaxID=1921010 RepID=A0A1L8CK82_9PROT|nr:site-specific integrase [Mariprofundus micogutta]GAV19310.1 site-specific tyrosine recombinase XerC [Mariprofundus micogutta]